LELLLIILGAVLAVGGGLLQQRQQQILDREREEDALFFQVENMLQRYAENRLRYADYPTSPVVLDQILNKNKLELEETLLRFELHRAALGIRSKEHRGLAMRILKLAIDEGDQTNNECSSLQDAVRRVINPELVADYEAEK